jgi:putative toxin-antitoxin system antitoxin component (TIGR02293 family)
MKTAIKKQVKEEDVKKLSKQLDSHIGKFLEQITVKRDYKVKKGALTFSNLFSDRMLIVIAIKEGIPYQVFASIQRLSPFSMNEWSSLLDLSTKSINRYRQADKRFKPIQSEKIIELAEVTKLGLEIFDSLEQFKLWLETPNFSLGRQKPLELLSDSYGKELVIAELTRIDQGIFA